MGGGERSPTGTPSPAQAAGAQVSSGYMLGDTPGCYSSVFSSFSTFLCIAANWVEVDKNICANGAKQGIKPFQLPSLGGT